CWQCGASLPRSAVFCPVEQGLIQPTYDESTFFDVLVPGTPPQDAKFKFDLDEKKLRRRFLELQTKVHPDGYGRKSATEKVCADQQSSFINKGYQSLKDPLPRAKYLLHMNGLSVGEGDSLDDKSLLMEVMEAREQLEEAATQDEIAYMKEENNERIDRTIQGLSDAFKSRDLQRAKRLTTELQYWINIQNAASDWSPGKRVEINH
ncbi:Co-chaperone HscB, C-terminal oligomerization domain-containing protein, partial [Phlyctochytrium arcticum]